MFGLGDLVKVEIDLAELRKEEVQDQLADILDKIIVFKGTAGIPLELVDKAFIKSAIKALVGKDEPE